jgi:hypothetical protein
MVCLLYGIFVWDREIKGPTASLNFPKAGEMGFLKDQLEQTRRNHRLRTIERILVSSCPPPLMALLVAHCALRIAHCPSN